MAGDAPATDPAWQIATHTYAAPYHGVTLANGGIGILLIPGSILLPHLPTHLSGQKCAVPQKKRQLHIAMCLTVCYNVSLRAR